MMLVTLYASIYFKVRRLADESDTERADMLENQVKQIVDRCYQMWESRKADNTFGPETSHLASRSSCSIVLVVINVFLSKMCSFLAVSWSQLSSATNLAAVKEELVQIVKENIGMLIAVRSWVVVLTFKLLISYQFLNVFCNIYLAGS